MNIVTLDSSNKVLGQDPIHPHIGKTFRTSNNRTAYGCEIQGVIAVVSCVAFTKGIATTMNKIAVESDSPDTAMFWTVYKTKEASQITELPTAVGAKALLQMVKHIQSNMPHIGKYATLSPIPTLSSKFTENMDPTAVNDWFSFQLLEFVEQVSERAFHNPSPLSQTGESGHGNTAVGTNWSNRECRLVDC